MDINRPMISIDQIAPFVIILIQISPLHMYLTVINSYSYIAKKIYD